MKEKILVTGASGFVGSHFVEAAFRAGYEVHAAVRKSSNVEHIKAYVTKFVFLNYDDIAQITLLFSSEKYAYVLHSAALTKAKTEQRMRSVNVELTGKLIDAAFRCSTPPRRFVFISSLAAIGPVLYRDEPLLEDSPYNPITIYGRSKQEAEEMIFDRFSDKPISIVRPTAVYGPREKDLFILFQTLNKGVDAYIGRSPQKLSFIYVKDLAILLLKACLLQDHRIEVFNATDGNGYSRYEIADVFKKTLSKSPVRLHIPYTIVKVVARFFGWLYSSSTKTPVLYPERLGELTAENWTCDISKSRTMLGFVPQYELKDGLRESLLWYKDNNWLK